MAATVRELWRFPVKSMGGSRVDKVRIDRRGVHAGSRPERILAEHGITRRDRHAART